MWHSTTHQSAVAQDTDRALQHALVKVALLKKRVKVDEIESQGTFSKSFEWWSGCVTLEKRHHRVTACGSPRWVIGNGCPLDQPSPASALLSSRPQGGADRSFPKTQEDESEATQGGRHEVSAGHVRDALSDDTPLRVSISKKGGGLARMTHFQTFTFPCTF